jgi:hypothetical protein
MTTPTLAVPAADFAAVGGFDMSLRWSEDREFCDRWLASGRRLVHVPDAIVRHDRPHTARAFGASSLSTVVAPAASTSGVVPRGAPGLRPSIRFYSRLVAQPLAQSGPTRMRAETAALVVGAQASMVAGYFVDAVIKEACRPPVVTRKRP